jgi:hypothetical protein
MQRWKWLLAAVPTVVPLAGNAFAADLPVRNRFEAPVAGTTTQIDLAFDATTIRTIFGYAAVTFSPFGFLEQSGFRVRVAGLAGHYSYILEGPPDIRNNGNTVQGDLLVGYEFVRENFSIAGYIGANVQDHVLSAFDPLNPVVGTEWGFKAALDIYANPTPNTLVTLNANYSTAFDTYYAKTKFGWAFGPSPDVFFGPEVTFLGNERFDQWRVGAHITGVKFGKLSIGVAGGYLHDREEGSGAYGTVDASVRF